MDHRTWCIGHMLGGSGGCHLPAALCRWCNGCSRHILPQTGPGSPSRNREDRPCNEHSLVNDVHLNPSYFHECTNVSSQYHESKLRIDMILQTALSKEMPQRITYFPMYSPWRTVLQTAHLKHQMCHCWSRAMSAWPSTNSSLHPAHSVRKRKLQCIQDSCATCLWDFTMTQVIKRPQQWDRTFIRILMVVIKNTLLWQNNMIFFKHWMYIKKNKKSL